MIKRTLLIVVLLSIPEWALAAQNHPAFQVQGQLFDEAGVNPITEVVGVKIGIYSADGNCLLYEEEKTGVDLTQSDGVFSLTIGSVVGAPVRTTGVDPGNAMAAVFGNKGVAIPAKVSAACPSGSYTAVAGDGRKLRLTVSWSGGTTVLSDQLISSVPQALVAETLQGLEPKNFLQVSNAASAYSLNKSDLDVAFSAGASDASTLHHHDSLYAKLSAGGSIALANSSYLGLGVHASSPDTTSWSGDPSKIGRTWYDSSTKEIKYWNGTAVQTLGTATLTADQVNSALGYTPAQIADGTLLNSGFPLVAKNGAPPEYAQLALDSAVTGTLPIANGGTGATSATGALNALVPSQAGNGGKFLTTDGSGVVSWASPGLQDNVVTTDTNQTISGTKTFSASATFAGIDNGTMGITSSGHITGSTGAGSNLAINATSNATTKGNILLNNGGGNVGIGLSSPAAKLEVAGDVAFKSTGGARVSLSAGGSASTSYVFPTTTGSSGQFLSTDGSGNLSWGTPSLSFPNQTGNTVFAGPDGATGPPSFRALGTNDLPSSIPDSKLAAISTAGKVENSATTATSANTASAIVARASDKSFTAGAITSEGNITATGSISANGQISANGNISAAGTVTSAGVLISKSYPSSELTGLSITNSSGNVGSDISIIMQGNGGGTTSRSMDIKYWPNPNGSDTGWYTGYDGANLRYSMGQLDGMGDKVSPDFVVTTAGKVGIGTASPAEKLDVNGAIALRGTTSGSVTLKAPAAAGSQIYELPANTGANGQVLMTDGIGTLSWKAVGTQCPDGTTIVRSGGPDAFCVSSLQPSSGWISAVKTCNTLKMHLCSAEEWVSACAELDASWTTEMQWTAELYSNNATALQKAGAGCSNMSVAASGTVGPYQYRCCSRPE